MMTVILIIVIFYRIRTNLIGLMEVQCDTDVTVCSEETMDECLLLPSG